MPEEHRPWGHYSAGWGPGMGPAQGVQLRQAAESAGARWAFCRETESSAHGA